MSQQGYGNYPPNPQNPQGQWGAPPQGAPPQPGAGGYGPAPGYGPGAPPQQPGAFGPGAPAQPQLGTPGGTGTQFAPGGFGDLPPVGAPPPYGAPPGPGMPGGPVPSVPPPPNAGRAKAAGGGRKLGLVIGGALGGVALLGLVGWGVMSLFGGGSMPFSMGQLPEDTKAIRQQSLKLHMANRAHLEVADLPQEALWSMAASMVCGGPDVFGGLYSGYGAPEDYEDKTALKDALECGRDWVKTQDKNLMMYEVRFKKGDKSHDPGFFAKGLKDMPEVKSLKEAKDPEGFQPSYCQHRPSDLEQKDSKECGRMVARLSDSKAWGLGSYEELNAFGAEWDPKGKHKLENASELSALLKGLGGNDGMVGIGSDKTAGVLPRADDAELTKKMEKLLKDSKAFGMQTSAAKGFESITYQFVMSGEGDAKDLEELLEKYMKSAKSKMKDDLDKLSKAQEGTKDDPKESKQDRERRKLRGAFERAEKKVDVRTMENPKISRSGAKVTLHLKAEPESDEIEAWTNYRDFNKERAKTVAEIVADLLKDKDPDKEALKELGKGAEGLFYPIDYVEFAGVDGKITVPGARCSAEFTTCSDKKTTKKEEAVAKGKAALEKAGFTVEDTYGILTGKKGAAKVTLFVSVDDKRGASYMFSKGD
jgi:hypothetical protein